MTVEEAASAHRSEIISRSCVENIEYVSNEKVQKDKSDAYGYNANLSRNLSTLERDLESVKKAISYLDETKAWETAGGVFTKQELASKTEDIDAVLYDISRYIGILDEDSNLKLGSHYSKNKSNLSVTIADKKSWGID